MDDRLDERLDDRLDERLDERLDDRLDERLDERMDDPLSSRFEPGSREEPLYSGEMFALEPMESMPRYLSEPPSDADRPAPTTPEEMASVMPAIAEPMSRASPPRGADALISSARESAESAGRDAEEAEETAREDEDADRGSAATEEGESEGSGAEGARGEAREGERPREGARAGRGGSAANAPDLGEDTEEIPTEIPPEVSEETEKPLEIAPLPWQPLAPQWQAAQSLPADALPMPTPPSGSATQTKPKDDKQGSAGGGNSPAQGKQTAGESDGSVDKTRRERDARDKARRAYLDVVNEARRQQQEFVSRTNQITNYMAQAYGLRSAEVTQAYDADLTAVDAAADRATSNVETAAILADLAIDDASRNAGAAIEAAGRSAYGLINADDRTAAARISEVVADLVSGHQDAYGAAIDSVTFAAEDALLALNAFRDERAQNYPTDGAEKLEGAKNETRQMRIPLWVEPVATELDERSTAKTTEWANTCSTTVCGLRCSYTAALETERTRVNTEGRASVASALSRARKALRDQTRDGRNALKGLRDSYLQQIATQRQATRSRLNSQARGTLLGLKQESQGAIGGVQSAARGALPAYWRGAQGLEQSLRNTASKGAPAIQATAERAPPGIIGGMRRSTEQVNERLQGNLSRLTDSLAERREGAVQQAGEQLAQLAQSLEEQGTQATAQMDQSAGSLREAFSGLSDSVSGAAASWAQPLATRLAAFIASKQAEADSALAQVLRGGEASGGGGGGGGGGGDESAAACGSCESAAGGGTATAGPAPASGSGAGGTPKGLTEQVKDELIFAAERAVPKTFFESRLTETGTQIETNLNNRAVNVAQKFEGGYAGTVDEEGVIAQLRGMTAVKGEALNTEVYPEYGEGTLDYHLRHYLGADSDDYATASAYLSGNNREGARRELEDSTGFFDDDEERIEATMRALSPEDLAALGQDPEIMEDVRGALGGTDLQVFDSLIAGDYAAADAYRMRDAVDEARRDNNSDAVHSAIEQYTGAPGENDYRSNLEISSTERRTAVVEALGGIVSDADVAAGVEAGTDLSSLSNTDRAVAYVTREMEVLVEHGGGGHAHIERRAMTGANRDLAAALLRHGENSLEARAARLGVEMQRTGEPPNAINLDRAMFDERFTPDNPNATPEERAANERERERARRDRARVLLMAAHYAPTEEGGAPREPADHDAVMAPDFTPNPEEVAAARDGLIAGLGARFGSDTIGAELAAGLLTDERPSARTASLAMQHAMYSRSGTNEDLMFRFTERMNRDEIAAMREQFEHDTGNSLDAELGTYGEGGTFTELSGDDRLRMERALRGVARTDQERLENAAYALAQQRNETGDFGAWLAEGTLAERVMRNTERRIERLAGGPIEFGRRGELTTTLSNFDSRGNFTGLDHDAFMATTSVAQTVAENYAKRIDAFADVATTGIAILGAIAAAVITVVTGGAAGPLIAAALVAGLASMAANAAIKGGRYGWEQAAVDLGMTAVQALTAGVGAQLGAAAQVASKGAAAASAASRSLATLSRLFTGNPIVDQIIIGAVTGSIGGVAGAAFDERTWERSGGDAAQALFAGLLKGALSGAATAALTNSIEALGRNGAAIADRARAIAAQGGLMRGAVGLAGRGLGTLGIGIGRALNASAGGGIGSSLTAMGARGLARGVISGLGGMAGRSTELLFDRATGKFRGRFGDALGDIGRAGLQAAVQGIGEGAGEAVGQGIHNQRLIEAATAINEARVANGAEPLAGNPLDEHSPIRAAAEDLMFMNVHGRNGSDDLGRALNLEHVATHGGMAHTVAVTHPDAAATDAMRAELMRHVPESLQDQFADVPIRVLSEAEFTALTRSESGQAVTMIEDGRPVVVIREGAPLSHLANEGPHLLQTVDEATSSRVARLDESTMARWDELDVDTQVDLYRNKIELEIDAHQRIADALDAAIARGDGDPMQLALDRARNEVTLENLRARHAEVSDITPSQRAAMQNGEMPRPQYLEQPPRLFSKSSRTDADSELSDEIRSTIEELEARIPAGGEEGADSDIPVLPDTAPEGGEPGRMFDRTPEEDAAAANRLGRGNEFNREDAMRMAQQGVEGAQHEIYLDPSDADPNRRRVDTVVPGEAIVERKYSQLAEVGPERAMDYIDELVDIYRPGRGVADVPTSEPMRGAGHTTIEGELVLRVPEQLAPIPREVLEYAARWGVRIEDPSGRVYSVDHPEGRIPGTSRPEDRPHALSHPDTGEEVIRASARDPDEHADAMREHLMRHVDPETAEALGDVPITVLPARDYDAQFASAKGPVVTTITDSGEPIVVIREGTPISRLADEGPHLVQARAEATRDMVASLRESRMAEWHDLDIDAQIDLYQTKIALEIDTHQTIQRSLEAELATTTDPLRLRAEIARNEAILDNLRNRQAEVSDITPSQRAAMARGETARPDYLDQPPRLFSKDPTGLVVFEPFVGPSLRSPAELQSRYPGARMIASEASHMPSPADVAEFEAGGGRFVTDRFGESLPDNAVDRMHVRFPLPHEKAQEMTLDIVGMSLDQAIAAAQAQQAGVESITNLAPHALRTLRPDGEMEIVHHEGSIAREIDRACEQIWTDPVTGRRYRLERVGEARMAPRAEVAPHSGHGIPASATEAHVVVLRKAALPRTPEEIAAIETARLARRQEKQRAREERAQARTQREEAERRRGEAIAERELQLDAETAQRVQDLQEGRITLDDDLRQRLATVAEHLQLDVDQLATVIRTFQERFGGHGRRYDAQDVIDSLRNRTRDGRPPRFDDLDGLVHEMALELNVIAVQQLREQIVAAQPDVVLGVERGGAFLAEVLARGVADFPEAKAIPKHVEVREGQEPAVRRTPHLEAEIRRRIEELGQRRFAIVDFYMGGVFAEELHAMILAIVRDHPYVEFEVLWMRETFGFEHVTVRPTRADLEEGVAFVGRLVVENGRLKIRMESPGVTLPPLKGVDPDIPQLHVTQAPVDIVLGDDMPSVLANDSKAPVRIFDRQGNIICVIPVGTPDPETGQPLDDTREIVRRLMQGAFGDPSRSGGRP